MRNKKNRVAFWEKSTGNLMSSGRGLTTEEILFLHSLKPGDRIIIWNNAVKSEGTNNPTHNMTIYEQMEKHENDDKRSSKSKKSLLA